MNTHPPDRTRWFVDQISPHEPSLRAFLGRMLPSTIDVDDIVQESYLRLWRRCAVGSVDSPKAFLFAVARNAALDFYRRRSRVDLTHLTETDLLPVMEEAPGVFDDVCRRQEHALLSEAIRALPGRCRQVFLLRKIRGLSQREIAKRLGISENTVETLVAKGTRRCADYLRAHGVAFP